MEEIFFERTWTMQWKVNSLFHYEKNICKFRSLSFSLAGLKLSLICIRDEQSLGFVHQFVILMFLSEFKVFFTRFWCKMYLFYVRNLFPPKCLARAHFRALCAPEYSEDPPKNQPKNDENHDFLTFQVHRARAQVRARPIFFRIRILWNEQMSFAP